MHEPFIMRVAQRPGHLPNDGKGLEGLHRTVSNPVFQVAATNKFQRQIVNMAGDSNIVYGHDVRMRKMGYGTRFLDESLRE